MRIALKDDEPFYGVVLSLQAQRVIVQPFGADYADDVQAEYVTKMKLVEDAA